MAAYNTSFTVNLADLTKILAQIKYLLIPLCSERRVGLENCGLT